MIPNFNQAKVSYPIIPILNGSGDEIVFLVGGDSIQSTADSELLTRIRRLVYVLRRHSYDDQITEQKKEGKSMDFRRYISQQAPTSILPLKKPSHYLSGRIFDK